MITDICFQNIVGNSDLKKRISNDISGKTVSHAYIIEGPRGVGRHTLALNISAALACASDKERPCCKCKNCKKIFGGGSPDIITLGLEGERVTIGVETIRRIKEDISTAPNDLDTKVYIIEDADCMTPQAQNAFLLSLEDPPEYVLFFLICSNSSSLLETVRSRAPILRMNRLRTDEVEKYILENDKRSSQLRESDERAFNTIVFAADGCIGRALELLDTKKRKQLFDKRSVALSMLSLLASQNRSEVLGLLSSLGGRRGDISDVLISVQYAVRDLLMLKKSDNAPLIFFFDREEAQELSTRCTSASLVSLYDALRSAQDELDANSNVRLTLLSMAQKAGLI